MWPSLLIFLTDAAPPVSSPSGVLSADWTQCWECSSECYLMLQLSLIHEILPRTQRLDLTRLRLQQGDNCCDLSQWFWHRTLFSLLRYAVAVIHMDWSELWTFFFLILLACQIWEACQAACSTNAFSLGDKMEMTRQSPFCQHCHGSTGTTVYPKVNGMTECQTGRKVRLFYLKWIDRRHWCHVTLRCESTTT